MPIITIDCYDDAIENQLQMVQMMREERKPREVSAEVIVVAEATLIAEVVAVQPKRKSVIKEEKANEMGKLLRVVRLGDRIEYTSYDNGACYSGLLIRGTVSKINATGVSITDMRSYNNKKGIWHYFYSENAAGNKHKPRVVRNLFKIL
tara:strand:+ start:205 stop:651 length:447 start_codon:yes stop_codon:yes gene_type:complete